MITPSVATPKRREPVCVTPDVVVGTAENANCAGALVVEATRIPLIVVATLGSGREN